MMDHITDPAMLTIIDQMVWTDIYYGSKDQFADAAEMLEEWRQGLDVYALHDSNGDIIASGAIGFSDEGAADEIKIDNIVVAEKFRKLGYGAKILGELIEVARDCGAESVYLDAVDDSEAFYTRLGFVAIENSGTNRLSLTL